MTLAIVDSNYNVKKFTFACDATSTSFKSSLMSVNGGKSVFVSVKQGDSSSTQIFTIGYKSSVGAAKNWYQPYVVSSAAGLTVSVKTVQEGGYDNNLYQTKLVLQEVKSLFISRASTFNATLTYGSNVFNFTATNGTLSGYNNLTRVLFGADTATTIKLYRHNIWLEYQIVFPASSSFAAKHLHVQITSVGLSGNLASVNTLTTSNNYPIFYNKKVPFGFSSSGQYTCYKREHNYTAWSYNTGYNDGIPAEVFMINISIRC